MYMRPALGGKMQPKKFRIDWMDEFAKIIQNTDTRTVTSLERAHLSTCIKNRLEHCHLSMEHSKFNYTKFLADIEALGYVCHELLYEDSQNVYLKRGFTNDNSLIVVNTYPHGATPEEKAVGFFHGETTCYTTSVEQLNELKALIETNVIEKESFKSVNIMVSDEDGLSVLPLKFKTEPLIRENYPENVVSGFNNIVKQLHSSKPNGRLHLLEGNPGTGKSRFITALVNEAKAKYIFVPVIEAHQLLSPGFMSFLANESSTLSVPLVIILEDSEALLQKRSKTSKGEAAMVSGILNLCDSPIAIGLNIHIISTFNSKISEFDDAIKRKGRLSTHIQFPELSFEQANSVFKRELKNDTANLTEERDYSLAEVYAAISDQAVEYLSTTGENGQFGVYN